MKLDRITISTDDLTLTGLAYTPESRRASSCIVLTHGFTSSKASMDLLAAYLCGRGYACLSHDVRGHLLGHSGGRLETMTQAVEDLGRVLSFAQTHFEASETILVGHSMGALLSFAAAADTPSVRAVAAIATGPKPSAGFGSTVGAAMLKQRSAYVEGAEPMRLLEQMDTLAPNVSQMGNRPSLFVAAKGDLLVSPHKLREMAAQAGPNAEFMEVEGAHLDAPDRARGAVANWLDRITAD